MRGALSSIYEWDPLVRAELDNVFIDLWVIEGWERDVWTVMIFSTSPSIVSAPT